MCVLLLLLFLLFSHNNCTRRSPTGNWQSFGTQRSQAEGFHFVRKFESIKKWQIEWWNFADWQAENSRQLEHWNWNSVHQQVSSYILKKFKSFLLEDQRIIPFCLCSTMKSVYMYLCYAMSTGPRAGTADGDGTGSCGHPGELRRCHVLHPHEEHPSGWVGQDYRHQLQGRMLVWLAGGCRMVFTYLFRSYWNNREPLCSSITACVVSGYFTWEDF